MKIKKISLVAIFFCASILFGSTYVSANEAIDSQYDMEQGGIQTFYETDEQDDLVVTEVSEDISNARMSDRSYTVKKSKLLKWEVSFKVAVKNNKITSVNSSQFKAITGSFSSTSCFKNSSVKATIKGKYKLVGFTSNVNVIATISNKKLTVQ